MMIETPQGKRKIKNSKQQRKNKSTHLKTEGTSKTKNANACKAGTRDMYTRSAKGHNSKSKFIALPFKPLK